MSEPLKDVIRELKKTHKSLSAASLKAGLNRDTLGKILNAERPNPEHNTLAKIAALAGRTVPEILGKDRAESPSRQVVSTVEMDALARTRDEDEPIPVLGTAAGSLIGAFEIDGRVIDYVERPAALRHSSDVYAIYVTGASMEPEHRPGDLRFIQPHRPARIGDSVIVQVQNAADQPLETYIGHLRRDAGEKVVLGKLNPPAEVSFKRSVVKLVHRVLTLNELFGR